MRYLYLLWLRTCFYLYLYLYLLLQQWDDKHNYRRKCDDDDDDGVGSSRRNRRDDDKKVWNNDTATITTATKRIIIVNVFLSVLFLCFCFDMKKSERETVAFFLSTWKNLLQRNQRWRQRQRMFYASLLYSFILPNVVHPRRWGRQ